jgi:hypothetical protein
MKRHGGYCRSLPSRRLSLFHHLPTLEAHLLNLSSKLCLPCSRELDHVSHGLIRVIGGRNVTAWVGAIAHHEFVYQIIDAARAFTEIAI